MLCIKPIDVCMPYLAIALPAYNNRFHDLYVCRNPVSNKHKNVTPARKAPIKIVKAIGDRRGGGGGGPTSKQRAHERSESSLSHVTIYQYKVTSNRICYLTCNTAKLKINKTLKMSSCFWWIIVSSASPTPSCCRIRSTRAHVTDASTSSSPAIKCFRSMLGSTADSIYSDRYELRRR